jgi:hypothetical protein
MKDAVRLPSERKPLGELRVRMAQRLLLDLRKTPGWVGGGGPHFSATETVAVAPTPVGGNRVSLCSRCVFEASSKAEKEKEKSCRSLTNRPRW